MRSGWRSPPVADSRQRRQTGREARQKRGVRFQAAQAEEGVSVEEGSLGDERTARLDVL